MRHSRACIKSKLDRSEQLVYVPWDTLAHIFIFHVFREGYKFLYIYTHIYKSVSKQAHIPKEVFWLCQECSPPSAKQTYLFQAQEDIIRGACVTIQKAESTMAR